MPESVADELSIRHDLQPGDIGTVALLHGRCYRTELGWDHTFEGYVAEGLGRFALDYDPARDRLWIAEQGGRAVGCIAVAHRPAEEAQLRWFLIAPELRGRGLGRRLLTAALEFCHSAGYRTVFLWTVDGLEAAEHLYLSKGFRQGEEDSHTIWGRQLTEVRYDLVLNGADGSGA